MVLSMPRNGRITGSSSSELPSFLIPAKQKKRQTNLISRVSGVGVGRARMFVCFIVYMFNMFVGIFFYLISNGCKILR